MIYNSYVLVINKLRIKYSAFIGCLMIEYTYNLV